MPEIPFRELPGFSDLFCDYTEGRVLLRGTRLRAADLENLCQSARDLREHSRPALQEFLRRAAAGAVLADSEITPADAEVLVWSTITANPAGGHLSDLLKALTAISLCRRLRADSIGAVAVICVDRANPSLPARLTAPDSEGRLRTISPAGPAQESFPAEEVAALVGTGQDGDAAELLCAPGSGAGASRAFARYVARHIGSGHAIVVDSSTLTLPVAAVSASTGRVSNGDFQAGWTRRGQDLSDSGYACIASPAPGAAFEIAARLPVAVVVSGPEDMAHAICWGAGAEAAGVLPPLPWPRLSATLLDARSRKLLTRHGLKLQDLFAGVEPVLSMLGFADAERETLAGLESIVESIRRRVLPLAGRVPEDLRKDIDAAAASLAYQAARLRDRFAPLMAQRLESVRRQMARLCDTAAPEGRPQESILALPWFFHRFSNTLPDRLLDRLDPFELGHQVLEME